jgi:DNA-binding CsgD family transcriptional regulator
MDDLAEVLLEAWATVKPLLRRDRDELRARLARRRTAALVRPPRACCLAVRANDTRITPATAVIAPEDAAYPGHRADYAEHEVVLDAPLLRTICRPVHILPMERDSKEAAELLGTTRGSLAYGMRNGMYRIERVWGLDGRRVMVPIIWPKRIVSDPGGGNAFEPPDLAWGSVWPYLADRLADDFQQPVRRVPVYRPYRGQTRFRGWRWVCPGCGRAVRTVFYPLPSETITEYLGDEAWLSPAGADPLPEPAPTFACHACHRVRYWSAAGDVDKAWNQLVGYLSGGLLYGREVRQPAWFAQPRRRRPYRPHRNPHAKGDQVMRGLLAGKTYAQIAIDLQIALATVQGHVRRIYRRYGVHKRKELRERLDRDAGDAGDA